MVNGVTFGEYHSFKDWKLLLNEPPAIGSPEPKTSFIDIPGADGKIDATDMLTGEVAYSTRELSFTFVYLGKKDRWNKLYSQILDAIHGKRLKIILDQEPDCYYIGRINVNEWKSDIKHALISIEAEVDPYKYELCSSLDDWIWDTFNFETGIIREYRDLQVDGEKVLTIPGTKRPVIPVFEVITEDKNGMDVIFNEITYHLPEGASRVLNIRIKEGQNILTLIGNGKVTVEYRGGGL